MSLATLLEDYDDIDNRLGAAIAAYERGDMTVFNASMRDALKVSNRIGHQLVDVLARPQSSNVVRFPDPVKPATVRRRRYRQRLRNGTAVLMVEVDSCELTRTLIAAGFVAETQSADRRAIEAATSRVVANWVRYWQKNSHA